jgi:hypothetical protein
MWPGIARICGASSPGSYSTSGKHAGDPSRMSRHTWRVTATASAPENVIQPPTQCSGSGCSRSCIAVTTPKFAPAPRSAQKSSGCSRADTWSTRSSAVTSSKASTPSTPKPWRGVR